MRHFSFNRNLFFYLLFCISLVLSWYFHKDSVKFCDHNELWSDRAGYYIYLPATFFYSWDAGKMPADLDIRTGGGFSLDATRNLIDTKYTYGVALMLSPFFLAAHTISAIGGYDDEQGFSLIYMRMMALAAVVYLVAGCWLLARFLSSYIPVSLSLLTLFFLIAGTNLFYYAFIEGMMSHVFSFFLFSLFLFALRRFLETQSYKFFLLAALGFSMAVLVRPTSILLIICFIFLDTGGWSSVVWRMRMLARPGFLLTLLVIFLLLLLPQLFYWKYLTGNWLHFSYRGEGFSNWRNPRIVEVLFSPVNGLFAYTPLALFMVAGIVVMFLRRRENRWLVTAMFLLVTMVCASWKMWYFGCSFGQRSYIEYFTILAIPLGWLLYELFRLRSGILRVILFFVLLFLVYANVRYIVNVHRFDRCCYGSTWDWDHYRSMVAKAGIFYSSGEIRSFENDFENLALCPVTVPSRVFTRSGQLSLRSSGKGDIVPLYSVRLSEFTFPGPKTMEVTLWVMSPGRQSAGTGLGYMVLQGNKPIFRDRQDLDMGPNNPMVWTKVSKTFIIPDVNDLTGQINLFLDNPGGSLVFADDLSVKFHYSWNPN